jgi:excisionase family DNA binding protein
LILPRAGGRRETDPPIRGHRALLARAELEAAAAERLIDAAVVAREMGVTGQTVRNWIDAERIVGVRTPGGRYRVPLFELMRLKKSQTRQARQI